jgi:hypothetical protein
VRAALLPGLRVLHGVGLVLRELRRCAAGDAERRDRRAEVSRAVGAESLVPLTIVAIAIAAATVGLRRKRVAQALALETRLSALLMSDSTVAGLSVVPAVQMPLWRGKPVTVSLKGHVPTAYLRDAIRQLIHLEMAATCDEYYLDDRLVVVGSTVRHAA